MRNQSKELVFNGSRRPHILECLSIAQCGPNPAAQQLEVVSYGVVELDPWIEASYECAVWAPRLGKRHRHRDYLFKWLRPAVADEPLAGFPEVSDCHQLRAVKDAGETQGVRRCAIDSENLRDLHRIRKRSSA